MRLRLRLSLACFIGTSAALAQAPPPLPPVRPATPPEIPRDSGPPPYEAQLDRLAELMGTLAYMRSLCGQDDGAAWHDKMAKLLEAEAKIASRKERLAGSYNRGYRGYQLTYHSCTPSALAVIQRSLEEGEFVAHELSIRFGGE
jgi:uncharacterized protein (TIGR02301 family)